MNTKTLPLLLSVCLGLTGFSVVAAETPFHLFTQQQDSAYASYRAALFQTSKQDQAASLKGINGFNNKWEQVIRQFADNPPEIFAADTGWKPTLTKVADIAARGTEQIKAGELTQAHETLEAIRDELSGLRSRNHLIFFSDRINSYHEEMEQLLLAGYSKDTIDSKAKLAIREQLAVLEFLAGEIAGNVPENYRADNTFIALQQGLSDSLAKLRSALDGGDPQVISQALQDLKPAYAKLFVKFG